MEQREKNVVEAAMRVIMRYGVKRTTMNDIAVEAGIARQTLYNIFQNKEDILRATIVLYAENSREAIRTEWETADDLGRKLDILFDHMVVRPYEMIQAMPDADDIVTGFNAVAQEEIERASEQSRQMIEEALGPYAANLNAAGLSLFQSSDFIQRSAYSFKKTATSLSHLQDLLVSLKAMVLTQVNPPRGGNS